MVTHNWHTHVEISICSERFSLAPSHLAYQRLACFAVGFVRQPSEADGKGRSGSLYQNVCPQKNPRAGWLGFTPFSKCSSSCSSWSPGSSVCDLRGGLGSKETTIYTYVYVVFTVCCSSSKALRWVTLYNSSGNVLLLVLIGRPDVDLRGGFGRKEPIVLSICFVLTCCCCCCCCCSCFLLLFLRRRRRLSLSE